MQTPPIIELNDVSRRFGETLAVADVNLAVEGGQIFGFIGPSGCGKTTTIRLLLGVLEPSDGEVKVMGSDPRHFSTRQREQIGYSPQSFYLYPTLSAAENVRFVAGLFGLGLMQRRRRARQVLQFLELWDARRRLARDLSGGMKRRLSLACALVHQPKLLFVDEPTAGLDPILRTKIWDALRTLRDQGVTIFVTTQYIDETEHCDNVAIMTEGHLAAVGTPAGLRRQALGGDIVEVESPAAGPQDLQALRQLPVVKSLYWAEPSVFRVVVDDAGSASADITQVLHDREVDVKSVRPYSPSFEDVFRKIVGAGA